MIQTETTCWHCGREFVIAPDGYSQYTRCPFCGHEPYDTASAIADELADRVREAGR
jgi:rRNA maturation endonuclease Nob1